MMEEDIKKLSVSSGDQFYHILKTDTFTFCLICFKDITSTSEDVGKHLESRNHTESIKCLFKTCNPSLIDDIERDRFMDVVLKSVIDISVLLGNETCYVSKKDKYWFCLMCEQNVTESDLVDADVKDNIIDHVLSGTHVKKVKEVCFLYRLNANKDFLLLNKSVVYCSICKAVMQCREVHLLNTAAVHLQKKHQNYAISHSLQCETSSFVKSEEQEMTEEEFKPTDGGISDDYPNTRNIPRTELAGEVKDEKFDDIHINDERLIEIVENNSMYSIVPNQTDVNKSFDKNNMYNRTNVYFCWCCKKEIKTSSGQSFVPSINNHFKQKHKDIYNQTSLEGLTNRIIVHNDPDKIKLLSEVISMKKRFIQCIKSDTVIKRNQSYILKTKTDYLCILCLVSVSPCIDDDVVVLDNFRNHFISSSHCQCHKEKKKTIKSFEENNKKNKTIIKLAQEGDIPCLNGESLVETVQDTSMYGNTSNRKDITKPFNDKHFFDGKNVCICLICKIIVTYVSGQKFLVSVAKHFRRAHRNVYLKTPLEVLINMVIFVNDPDKIKLISEVGIMKKSFKKLIQRSREIKKHSNYILKTRKHYVCIICFFNMSPCLDDDLAVLEHLQNHFTNPSHHQCENEQIQITNQVFKVDKKDNTVIKLTNQKEKLRMRLQRKKAKRKFKKNLKEMIKLKQKGSTLRKGEGKHKIKQVKKETCQ